MDSDDPSGGPAGEPTPPTRRSRRWLTTLLVLLLPAGWWVYWATRPAAPSVRLPDGTMIVYHSASRGRPATKSPSGAAMFEHAAATNESRLRDAWLRLRSHCPPALHARLPDWPAQRTFHSGTFMHELELRFLVPEGSLRDRQWQVGIADDDGWETLFNETGWASPSPPAPGSAALPGQWWLPGPVPRHSRTLRLRFHPTERAEPKLSAARKRETVAELVLANPFYEGPAAPPTAAAPPLTKRIALGDVTLTRVERSRLVGPSFGGLSLQFDVRKLGQPVTALSFDCERITDRSGQWFRVSEQGGSSDGRGRHHLSLYVAPWSDDPSWKFRIRLHRDHGAAFDESEILRFEHLPVPRGTRTEVNRSVTRNGVTLHIGAIELSKYGDWRFCVEGWRNSSNERDRWLVIHDARDDQDRTQVKTDRGTFRLVGGPVGGSALGPTYSLHLPPDAREWNLQLVPEIIETLEFETRPAFVDR